MQTSIPHSQSYSKSPLNDVICVCRAYAWEYANTMAEEIQPIIMPYQEWLGHWDFAWNSVFAYASQGLTTAQLYSQLKEL